MNRFLSLERAKSFALFYGRGEEEALSSFDLVIVEPKGQSTSSLKMISSSNTMILAYLSLVEINPADEDFPLLQKEDFILRGRNPVINYEFGNYLVDPRSKRWRKIVMDKVGKLLTEINYDGLFFDTLGDLENQTNSSLELNLLMLAGADLLRQIRKMYPAHVLIQNNGIEKLARFTAPFLNAYCWENPPFDQITHRDFVFNLMRQQQKLCEGHQLKLLLLFEQNECGDITIAAVRDYLNNNNIDEKKFLIYIAPPGYCRGIITEKK